jgi:hypothetical protein
MNMKKIGILLVLMLFVLSVSGCRLFGHKKHNRNDYGCYDFSGSMPETKLKINKEPKLLKPKTESKPEQRKTPKDPGKPPKEPNYKPPENFKDLSAKDRKKWSNKLSEEVAQWNKDYGKWVSDNKEWFAQKRKEVPDVHEVRKREYTNPDGTVIIQTWKGVGINDGGYGYASSIPIETDESGVSTYIERGKDGRLFTWTHKASEDKPKYLDIEEEDFDKDFFYRFKGSYAESVEYSPELIYWTIDVSDGIWGTKYTFEDNYNFDGICIEKEKSGTLNDPEDSKYDLSYKCKYKRTKCTPEDGKIKWGEEKEDGSFESVTPTLVNIWTPEVRAKMSSLTSELMREEDCMECNWKKVRKE